MGDMLADGMAFLAETMKAHASQPVTYRRGAQAVVIQAQLDSEMLRVSDGRGQTKIERTDLTVIFTAADLVLSGPVVEPADDDLVDVTLGGTTNRYQVMPYGQGEPSWHYTGADRVEVAVRVKFLKAL